MFGNQTQSVRQIALSEDVLFTGCFVFLKGYFRVFGRVGKRDSQGNPVFGAKTWFLQRLGAVFNPHSNFGKRY